GPAVDLLLDPVQLTAVRLDDREVMIDDRIDQGVGQEVGTGGADAAAVLAQPLPNRLQAVAGAFLKGYDIIAAEKDGDLLVFEPAGERDHAGDDEQVV